MCSEALPKEFVKKSEILPFNKYGVTTIDEFKKAENRLHHMEWLKKAGLSNEEIQLYQDNEAGILNKRQNIESGILKHKLAAIYNKINQFNKDNEAGSSSKHSKSASTLTNMTAKAQRYIKFYPLNHPMNAIKEVENELFGHLNNDNILPITKRRKILRRLEHKKEKLSKLNELLIFCNSDQASRIRVNSSSSLWDMKECPVKSRLQDLDIKRKVVSSEKVIIGPKKQTMYTIKDKKIVRLEPIESEKSGSEVEYKTVDIVVPMNPAEEQLLEGTKISIDDIKKIDRFKDYEPGVPSKVLYLKNIASTITQEQLSILFNQFMFDNGGPVDLKLMSGRMRGQAFAGFNNEDVAIRALEEINGTIVSGRPIIAQFGRNSNRIQTHENN